MNKTYSPRPCDVRPNWYIVDASGQTLGRLSSLIATYLQGKRNPLYTPHKDMGDHIIIINAEKISVTGNKREEKRYNRHTGYPGGIKYNLFQDLIKKHPERPLEKSIRGMLPKGALGNQMFKKLKVYAGSSHPHEAQKPKPLPEFDTQTEIKSKVSPS